MNLLNLYLAGLLTMALSCQKEKIERASGIEQKAPHQIVVIYAGHMEAPTGKNNQGSTSTRGIPEYQFNDNIVSQFPALSTDSLEYKVHLAKENIPLQERPSVSDKENATAYIEIHHDSAQLETLQRLQNGVQTPNTWKEVSGFSVFYSVNNPYVQESRDLAMLIARNLIAAQYAPNRYHALHLEGEQRKEIAPGVYEADFLVLKNTELPAVLVERGVITNPFEEEQLNTTESKKKFVDAVDKAVKQFIFH